MLEKNFQLLGKSSKATERGPFSGKHFFVAHVTRLQTFRAHWIFIIRSSIVHFTIAINNLNYTDSLLNNDHLNHKIWASMLCNYTNITRSWNSLRFDGTFISRWLSCKSTICHWIDIIPYIFLFQLSNYSNLLIWTDSREIKTPLYTVKWILLQVPVTCFCLFLK